ncbi:MAG: orotate phosphoribosyltransferase [Acidimicrobiales bacterium]
MDASDDSREDQPDGLRARLVALVMERGYERRPEPFQLSSGGTSYDYVDMRRAVAGGADLELAARAVVEALAAAGIAYDAIGGMTMGADPVAHAVAVLTGCSWYSVRKATKGHGTGRRIEGVPVGPGVRVVVLEDTVSTGQSLLDAYEVVRGTGADVVVACTILDRGDAMAARMGETGTRYLPVLTYRDVGLEPLGEPTASPGG